jgi:two-component system, response regulator
MMNDRPVLIAESDPNDVVLLQRAFPRAGILHPLIVVHNGREAIDYLDGHRADPNAQAWPALMLLDLKMPLMDGMEVLRWWQNQRCPRELPIIVLTGSASESELRKVLMLGATDWRHKPHDFDDLVVLCQELRFRWLSGPVAV